MSQLSYGHEKTLPKTGFDDAIARATAALKAEGFGILTTIDVRETLKQKIGADFRRYVILGACNPHLAHQALSAEPHIGLMMPCNVVVQERAEGGTTVSIQDPLMTMSVTGNPKLKTFATEADARIRRVLAAL